ncbi:hypothetical protein [Glycocaulis abyssi]|uniref:Uncharacterized protein n=1 Tax=Glycocaulis abyssi TaxID=1433403 RepID=A0ABV9NF80_9PROT
MSLATRSKAFREALSSLAAGVIDDAGTLAGLKPFKGEYVIIDAWLPVPRLRAARRLVAADPAAWCPLHESEAVIGVAGPVELAALPPWRYRVAIARRVDLLSPDGRALRERRLVDEATGLTMTLPAPRRSLAPGEAQRLLAVLVLFLSLSWALAGAAVFLENSAAATTASARALAVSAGSSREDARSHHAAALHDIIIRQEEEPVSAITISGSEVRLTLPDGSVLVPAEFENGAAQGSGAEREQTGLRGEEP